MISRRMSVTVLLVTVFSSCATVPDNPRQQKVRSDFEECKRETGAHNVEIVSMDAMGNFRWDKKGSAGDDIGRTYRAMGDCLRARKAERVRADDRAEVEIAEAKAMNPTKTTDGWTAIIIHRPS